MNDATESWALASQRFVQFGASNLNLDLYVSCGSQAAIEDSISARPT